MLKKFLIATALVFSVTLGAMAQGDIKIAYVITDDVFAKMPEVSDYESSLATLNESYKKELSGMQDEYNKKYNEVFSEYEANTKLLVEEQLRAQVRDFIEWLQGQGII